MNKITMNGGSLMWSHCQGRVQSVWSIGHHSHTRTNYHSLATVIWSQS